MAAGADAATPALRCAVHPSRPAVDECPTCRRPRCGADAAAHPGACASCGGVDPAAPAAAAGPGRVAGAVAVALGLGALGGWVATEYIGASGFAEIVPLLVGLVCASGAAAVAGTHRGRTDLLVRLCGAVAAVLGCALGYKLQPGGGSATQPLHEVAPTYVSAVVGAAASRLLR
jgi:hypothetical protein